MSESRTYRDRAAYIIAAVSKRRLRVKALALEYRGGKCEICGYSKSSRALGFHHLDPAQKDFGIGERGYTRSWDKVRQELDKCVLVCANCHSEIHEGMVDLSRFGPDSIIPSPTQVLLSTRR